MKKERKGEVKKKQSETGDETAVAGLYASYVYVREDRVYPGGFVCTCISTPVPGGACTRRTPSAAPSTIYGRE